MQATQRQILQLIFAAEQGISDQHLLEKIGSRYPGSSFSFG
jgi:hypothetical protein